MAGEEERTDEGDEQPEEKQPAEVVSQPEGETEHDDGRREDVNDRRNGLELELAHKRGSVEVLGELAVVDGLHGVSMLRF